MVERCQLLRKSLSIQAKPRAITATNATRWLVNSVNADGVGL